MVIGGSRNRGFGYETLARRNGHAVWRRNDALILEMAPAFRSYFQVSKGSSGNVCLGLVGCTRDLRNLGHVFGVRQGIWRYPRYIWCSVSIGSDQL
jgi:hypothetical protein